MSAICFPLDTLVAGEHCSAPPLAPPLTDHGNESAALLSLNKSQQVCQLPFWPIQKPAAEATKTFCVNENKNLVARVFVCLFLKKRPNLSPVPKALKINL